MSDKSDNNNNRRRRVVIVTGSGRGIGKAIAIEFAKAGYYVMMNDFEQEEELKRTAEEISKLVTDDKKNNNKIAYVVGDISQERISISLIEETIKRFGRIDVLINNAEIAEKPTMKKTTTPTTDEITTTTATTTSNATNSFNEQISPYFTLEEYEIADLYLKGIYLCIREAVKRMVMGVADKKEKNENDNKNNNNKRKKSNYSIINISSPYQSIPKLEADEYTFSMSGVDPFTSSRAGVKSLTKTVALQLAEKGIRVNAIAPGLIATDIINKELREKEEKRKEKEKEIPFHRIGEPAEIAKIALFLASDDASYITGNMIYVDGGLSLSHSNYFLESKLEQD
ncbi:MAG TPA: SDR family oxidoreductase [Nitrososphaeraceae archaeon]|nr:SDR family oxidoreductase [Nitrososphaeraceae archaeon]